MLYNRDIFSVVASYKGYQNKLRSTLIPRAPQQTYTAATVVASPARRFKHVPRFKHASDTITRAIQQKHRSYRTANTLATNISKNELPTRFSTKEGGHARRKCGFRKVPSRSFHRRIARRLHPPRCREILLWNFAQGGVISYHPGVITSTVLYGICVMG